MNHFGYADYYIGVGHVGNGKFNIANDLTGNDFVIDTSGNVGIGADSPDFALDIEAVSSGVQLQMGRTNTNVGSTWMGSDSNGFHLGVGAYGAGNSVSDPNGFTVLTSGNVGIGTASPNAKLEIKASGSTTGLTFKTTDAASNENFFIQDGGRTGVRYYPLTVGQASGTAAASNARFQVATTGGDFVVMNDGKTGIGTTTPERKLDVKSNSDTAPSAYLRGGKSSQGEIQNTGLIIGTQTTMVAGDYQGISFTGYTSASAIARGRAAIGVEAINGPGKMDLVFMTRFADDGTQLSASDEKMRISSSGNVTKPTSCTFSASTVTPGVSVGTTEVKIAYSSQQVDVNSNYDTTNYRFTAPVAGNYLIGTTNTCYISTGVTVYMAIYIRKNGVGTAYRFRGGGVDLDVNDWFGITGSVVIPLAAGDYIELWGYANAGSFQIVNTEGHFYGYLIG